MLNHYTGFYLPIFKTKIDAKSMRSPYDKHMKTGRDVESSRAGRHLFTVSVWAEEKKKGLREWRGRVQMVSREGTHYFRGWQGLVELLQSLLPDTDREENLEAKGES